MKDNLTEYDLVQFATDGKARIGIIKALSERNLTTSRIARDSGISPPSVNRALKALREKGLVDKVPTRLKKCRGVFYHLTEVGRGVYGKCMELRLLE